jgi:hypothetical protein
MDTLLSRHLPMITNRLEFFPQNIGPPPIITSTIDFANRLANKEQKVANKEQKVATEDSDSSLTSVSDNYNDDDAMDTNASPAITPVDIHSDSESEEIADTVDKKIPKPRGQPGHPRCGGYSLDVVLRKWGSTLIADVNVNN